MPSLATTPRPSTLSPFRRTAWAIYSSDDTDTSSGASGSMTSSAASHRRSQLSEPSLPLSTSTERLVQRAGPEESLRAYKLLDSLRKGDQAAILPFLEEAQQADTAGARKPVVGETGSLSGADSSGTSTPLHLAVRCAKHATVDFVYKHHPASVNAQDARGQTPVHLAAALDRRDVLAFFLAQENVDDMIRDLSGKTCLEVAATPEAAGVITLSRYKCNEMFLALLAAYIASPASDAALSRSSTVQPPTPSLSTQTSPLSSTTPAFSSPQSTHQPLPIQVSAASGHVSNAAAEKLYHFIAKPRARCLDFAMQDHGSGTTVLHEAVRRKDLGLIKLVLGRGGDVLARDRKGKLPVDLAKDERIKSVLRQAANSEGKALQAASKEGGAGAGAAAPLLGKPPSMRGYLSKWTNMARGWRSRWFVLENGVLSYYRSQEDEGKASRGSISMSVARVAPPETDKLKFTVSNKLGKSMPSFYLKGNHPVEAMRWVEVLRQNIEYARDQTALSKTNTAGSTYAPSITGTLDSRRPSDVPRPTGDDNAGSSPAESAGESVLGDDETFNGDEDDIVPHEDDFHLLAQGTKTQLELTQQLLDSLVVVGESPSLRGSENGGSSRPASVLSASGRQADVKEALKRSLASLDSMLDDYIDVVRQRERYFVHKYEKEVDAKRMWEESMKEVAAQHAALEVELQKASRDNTRRKRALQEVRANLGAASPGPSPRVSMLDAAGAAAAQAGPLPSPVPEPSTPTTPFHLPEDGARPLPSPLRSPRLGPQRPAEPARSRAATVSLSPARTRGRATTMQALGPADLEQIVDSALHGEDGEESSDEDDDDEFFEAIEAGVIPLEDGEGGVEQASADDHRTQPAKEYVDKLDLTPYKGYAKLRTSLPITNDNRPSVSLWAILKGSIGKDLTKISFPVYFNEPTSMLQRMAEDIEFTECLDAAAADPDSSKRIAFVAAFAMSNYSSTIGRIAKPFNPMLSETFEYVDPKKKYRYISEQVCHHPPISACIAQSPSWEYFGSVDAKSKFMGKSFEIRPTGVAHINLRLPKEWAPDYPAAATVPDLVEEHYSWTKVTTSVSNFLLGNPIIDHYGDMVVTNHRTGEVCTLTFKPRGWRGGNACEIKGQVVDAQGQKSWDIAGKWSSQLVARRVGAGTGELAPDASLPTNTAGEVAPEYIRLWKNSPKPPDMPFNLTPFAVTLNDINDELKPWLPPTDCRLRPDQHAFESGKFERANTLKSDLEDHQRETRRRRERGELPPHRPRWFSRKKDADTGELFWEPVRVKGGALEYWEERNRVGASKLQGVPITWKDVDPIYADFQA
ncbi:hypothetical protein JCM21900_003782 [Sporobolomyces salmonicolor]